MKKFLVVGSGISGATISNLIAHVPNSTVQVIDSRGEVGGNCYDYRDDNNIMIHKYGSHIFHTFDHRVWSFVNQFVNFNVYMHKVIALIDGIETTIPFNFNTLHDVFPESLAVRLEKKLLLKFEYNTKILIKDFIQQDDSDLRFLANYVYENVFLHYTEKQWGSNFDTFDVVTSRVPLYLSKDDRYFQDTYQGIPLDGYTMMISRMLDCSNIHVKCNTSFSDIDDLSEYDCIFYTGPIDELMGYELGQLPYRSLKFKTELHHCEHYQSNAVVNYPCNYDFTRIHEYKYYLDDKSDKTVIAKEYPIPFSIGENERYYPILNRDNQILYDEYLRRANLRYPNMYFLGRLGDYKYYDMDKAILRAMQVYYSVFDDGLYIHHS